VTLAVDLQGPADATPLVLVHGFTQNSRCWGPAFETLREHYALRAVDAPGHGRSPAEHDAAAFADAALLVGDVGGRGTYVGYSMGGRLCLRLACERPDLVERLVLIGATPGLRDAGERAARRRADAALADRLEAIGLPAFLDEWLALPLFAGLPPEAQARRERLTNRVDGVAASLRHCGTGNQDPLWDRLGALTMPVLLIVGEHDAKFRAVADEVCATCPAATAAVVPGAGHSAHLEQPHRSLVVLQQWLHRHPTGSVEQPT